MGTAKNYVGSKIGKFEILEQYSKNDVVYLKTMCTMCGKIDWVAQKHVATRKCCESASSSTQFKSVDYSNLTVNGITLLKKTDKKSGSSYLWKCRCHCGNIFYANAANVKAGKVKSCGCITRPPLSKEFLDKGFNAYSKKYLKEHTNLSAISPKMLSTNKSGVKGVYFDKSKQRWIAVLEFQKKRHVKSFTKKEDAIRCRKEWEEKYFKPILDKYDK